MFLSNKRMKIEDDAQKYNAAEGFDVSSAESAQGAYMVMSLMCV